MFWVSNGHLFLVFQPPIKVYHPRFFLFIFYIYRICFSGKRRQECNILHESALLYEIYVRCFVRASEHESKWPVFWIRKPNMAIFQFRKNMVNEIFG